MRVGMICPYSLTVHGGVQNQVLGLARALRMACAHDPTSAGSVPSTKGSLV